MSWLRSTLEGAGLERFGVSGFLIFVSVISVAVGAGLALFFRVPALGVFGALGLVGFSLELLAGLAKKRRSELLKLWPEVVDSIASAVAAGISLPEAFQQLSNRGPMRLRMAFGGFNQRLDVGWGTLDALDWLKSQFGEVHSDRLIEVLRLSTQNGGEALGVALKSQSKQLREDIVLLGQLESKQGWVSGTAKLAVASPWIIVAMLSIRPENAAIYNSTSGAVVLLVGFLISIGAYRVIHLMSLLPQQPRVFA